MGNNLECRLPPLNSLALDFALPHQNAHSDSHNTSHYFSPYPTQYFHHDHSRTPPAVESTRTLPSMFPCVTQLKPDIFNPAHPGPVGLGALSSTAASLDTFSSLNTTRTGTPLVPGSNAYVTHSYPASYSSKSSVSDSASEEPTIAPTFSPVGAPFHCASILPGSLPAVPAVMATSYHFPPLNECARTRPYGRALSEEPLSGSDHESTGSSKSPDDFTDNETHEPLKKRKKRQCPQCLQYFSNLATHRSTHLNPTARPHVCKVCQRGFARPNDLFRHFKCHWKEMGADHGQFKCPFKSGPAGDKCSHTLGIFSRCDTYKNHLKAIHFQYPEGTKKSHRSKIPGTCKLCSKEFKSVDDWISLHIETHQCLAIE